MERISQNISFSQGTVSATAARLGIRNQPTQAVINNMKVTAEAIYEPLVAHFGVPPTIISFFRSPALNRAVGGSQTSQHMTGQALDLRGAGSVTNAQLFNYIRQHLPFDQLIWEFGTATEPSWVHVSFVPVPARPRRQVLRAIKRAGKTVYQNFN